MTTTTHNVITSLSGIPDEHQHRFSLVPPYYTTVVIQAQWSPDLKAPKGRPSDQPLSPLGLYLQSWRRVNGMTQAEFGRQTRLTITSLSNIERGRVQPKLKTLKKMAAVTGDKATDYLILAGLLDS